MYNILLFPMIAGTIAQLAKLFIPSNRYKWNWRSLVAYSGMPSMHSAIVVSLAVIMGLELGFSSPSFALSFFLAIFIIRDAFGLRQYLGNQGKVLNVLVRDLKEDDLLDRHYPRLLEKIGHTPAQVLVGAIIGFLVSLIGYYII